MPLLMDIETRSRVDLPECGGFIYSRDPSTQILCAAFMDTEDASCRGLWVPMLAIRPPESAIRACLGDVPLFTGPACPLPTDRPWVAHNAWGFDQLVWDALGLPGPSHWIDTAPLARACGLPGALEAIGKTLRGDGKHKEGKGHLKKFMAYQKEPRAGDLLLIGQYCWDDVGGLLAELWKHIERKRRHMTFEDDVIAADRVINDRGIRIDTQFAERLLQLSDVALQRCLLRISELTKGKFTTLDDLRKLAKVHEWLASKGIPKMSLARGAIKEWLSIWEGTPEDDEDFSLADEDDQEVPGKPSVGIRPSPEVIEFLTLRSQATKITAHKIKAALRGTCEGRIRHILAYYAAHTGRWGGRRLQPQNLPQPHEQVPVWEIAEAISAKAAPEAVDELLDKHYDPSKKSLKATLEDACGSSIRGILLPEEGQVLTGWDYNAIEFRGVGWLADEPAILDLFAAGKDPYSELCIDLFKRPPAHKKDPIRQVAKVVDLGSIYQISGERLGGYFLSQGIVIEEFGLTPQACVEAFRNKHPRLAGIPTGRHNRDTGLPIRKGGFWREINDAAILAVKTGRAECGRLVFAMMGEDLHMVLPSGRPIVYRKAFVAPATTKFGTVTEAVHYWSPRGFQNTLYGGKLTENAVQGLCRDLLAAALVRCVRAGIVVLLHVHDEIVASVRGPEEALLVGQLMAEKPKWAEGFPVACEGEIMPRYAKAAPKGSWNSEVKS